MTQVHALHMGGVSRFAQVYDHWASDVKESGVPINDPFKIEGLLTNDADIAKWNKEGLPANEMSIQNGILTTMSSRWPLCIDPQMQVCCKSSTQDASKWRRREALSCEFVNRR